MSYTVDELVGFFRRDMDDVEAPYLWSDEDIYGYLNLAQRKLARETLRLFDSRTVAVTQAAVVADDRHVPLHPSVIKVRSARLATAGSILSITNFNDMDSAVVDDYGLALSGDWEQAVGTPRRLIMDMDTGTAVLYPKPVANDTLVMSVYRYPLRPITDGQSLLEFRDEEDQLALVWYARHLGYDKHDSETRNDSESDRMLTKFLAHVRQAKAKHMREKRRAGTVRYNGL